MFRKPIFWILLTLAAFGCIFFTLKFFPQAFPLINLDLKMDREAALQLADSLTQKHQWGPAGYKTAASFGLDNVVQNFVELEAGGTEAFRKFLVEGFYSPYTWSVRHFKENETNETMIRFTPAGQPYGFQEKLPENQAGAALTVDSAQFIAVTTAGASWNIDFTPYQLVEKSQEVRPGGRIDHSFVYERINEKIGEARYRLRLVVGGDKLIELTHFMKIPEAFSRRFEEMRSANETIASADVIVMIVLYGIAGCIGGIFYLLRKKWLQWRKPVFWALFIAVLMTMVEINRWPLTWMSYDTAISAQGFVLRQIMMLLITFLAEFGLLGLTFMVAESLTRRAFPDQIQLWRIWNPGVANSKSVLGQTIGGFIMVAVFLAFDVAVYFIATQLLGWWTPSEALFQPDILATYFPWLSSIAISLHAGFWEESMFRAIPLAGAALIGDRFGKRRLMIVIAIVIQALIFGAGHANYAQQPAYARIVELFVPSLAFAGLYLYFGLLPAIIMHFVYDVVWFALPLFVSTAAGIWIDQLLVIILTIIPILVILWYWLKKRKFVEVAENDYNRAWQPEAEPENEPEELETIAVAQAPSRLNIILGIGGILGIILWFMFSNFQNEAPKMNLTRPEAVEIANKALAERNINLSPSWQTLSTLETPLDQNDRFIWQTAGEDKYRELMGNFISPPQWRVRFAQFEGDLAERAEEYQVFISTSGEVIRFRHQLPERRPGATLAEPDAKKLADSVVVNRFHLKPEELKQISIEPSKLQARMDWLVTYADTLHQPLKEGEARLSVKISGNEIVDSYRFIHVPEDWGRQERNKQNVTQIVSILSNILR
ncbi:CPBP family intramembrane metalloprotease, partial [candidate division KSB1 bacterium]|nr:CPBP family intramembrane metalloprotease [candidate division KSB1 bacterium]